jgi:hypothetical protein
MIQYRKILELYDEGISLRGISASTSNARQKVTEVIELKLWVSGTIKRQKGHFEHVESTTDFIERESKVIGTRYRNLEHGDRFLTHPKFSNKIWVSGTIKRQKGHFVHMESTTNFIES